MVNCEECNNNKGIERAKLEKTVCKDCYKLDKYTLVAKTKAKKEYILNDNDFVSLKIYFGTAAYGSGLATYYTKEQIIQKACEIHNTTQEQLNTVLEELKNQKQIKKQYKQMSVNQNKAIKKINREYNLTKALNQAGLELRNDSVLCKKYIDGDGEIDLDKCVQRMCEMKYLFEYCHMDECKAEAYEENCEELRAGYFPDCSVFDKAEDIALRKYSNGYYPNIFPWQIK